MLLLCTTWWSRLVCVSDVFGGCADKRAVAEVAELSALFTTTTTTQSTSNEAAKGSAASLPIIPIAAAAGGGILLVVIIVIILVRRRRNQPQNGGDKRAVVAFENPMYEQGKGSNGGQAIYDNKDGHEGLYDEPAFAAKTDKSNPLYNSNENLAHKDEFGGVAAHLKAQALPDDYDEPAGHTLVQQPIYGDDYLQTQGSHQQVQPDYDTPLSVTNQPVYGDDYLQAGQSAGFALNSQPLYDNDQQAGDGYLDVVPGAE